jgi:hypothetical protein
MGYDKADTSRNAKINAEQKEALAEEKVKVKADLKYLQNLKDLKSFPQWQESVEPLLDEYKTRIYKELIEESSTGKDGKIRQVEPGELMIRQRVHNRVKMFINQFEFIEEKMKDMKAKLSQIEKDEEALEIVE